MTYENLADDFLELKDILALDKVHSAVVSPERGSDFVLLYIQMCENVSPKDLSEAMGVSTARMAVILNSMEQKQLVERKKSTLDGRKTVIAILPEGKKIYEKKKTELRQIVLKLLESLGEEDAADYVRLHKRLAENLPNIL